MTPSDLYAMAMESPTADEHLGTICALLGITYPPEPTDHTQLTFNTQGKHNVHSFDDSRAIRHRQDNQPAQPQPC